jgi:hypothetical protein
MGKKSNGGGIALAIIVVLALLVASGNLNVGNLFSSVSSGSNGQQSNTGCSVNPSLTNAIVDASSTGTAVTPTNYYRFVTASPATYQGTTAPTVLGTYEILITSAGYVSKVHPGFALNCGSNVLTDSVYAYANDTITVYANNGLSALTNSASGGVYNETVMSSTGGSYTWKYHLQGVNLKSTGPQMLIVETALSANVSSISLSGGVQTTTPRGYSSQIAGGYIQTFSLPAVTGSQAVDYYLTASALSGKLIAGPVYTTLYSMQPFVETDGTFNPGTSPFDSLGATKYHDVQTYNWFIK